MTHKVTKSAICAFAKRNTVPMFGTLLVAAFPALFLYLRNAGEAHFSDVAPTLLLFMVAACALFLPSLLFSRSASKAGLIASLILLVFLNYAPIENAIQAVAPVLRYWHIVPLLLIVLCAAAAIILKKMPADLANIAMPVMSMVFLALIAINGIYAMPHMIKRINAEKEAALQTRQTVESSESMPNFYFLLFDEFSTIPFMQKHYSYDNSELVHKLEKLGFNTSQTGHNEWPDTAIVTADLFQLDYVAMYMAGDETGSEKNTATLFELRSNNPVFQLFRKSGYQIGGLSAESFYGIPDLLSQGSEHAKTFEGIDAAMILQEKTVIYPFIKKSYTGSQQTLLKDLAYLKTKENFPESNQFTLFHIYLPHLPFWFDRHGNPLAQPSSDWDDKHYYLDQYIFASDQMFEVASSVIKNDPNAIVWILSDHSARGEGNSRLYMKEFTLEDMTNFFNAVYFQGKPLDIEGLSAVNTFRLILNQLFGTDYEMVDIPRLGGGKLS